MLNRYAKWTLVAFAASSLFGIAGCGGSSTQMVTGKVTVKGKPVFWGNISFMDANGNIFPGGIDDQGNYAILNVPSGVMKVGVNSDKPSSTPNAAIKYEPGTEPPPVVASGPPPQWVAVAAKYADPKTSGKEVTVKSGSTVINIELE